MFRKATAADIDAIAAIYDRIHTAEENGENVTGWIRGIYPVRNTALAALERGDLFVLTKENRVIGSMVLNQRQDDFYALADWEYKVSADQVMVMHTLAIDPLVKGQGFGRQMAAHYEQYASKHGCRYLRIDTNIRNQAARNFYAKLGYREIGSQPCDFNGLLGVELMLLEKKI